MPDERFIHPAEGESEKVAQLTDFEYRVWQAFKLAANDVGVMLDSTLAVQAGNRYLRNLQDKSKAVRKALDRMLQLELLIQFKHQGQHYVCSPVWQDWQQVKYPRQTHLPLPDDGTRARCSDVTRALFLVLERLRSERREKLKKVSEQPEKISKHSEMPSENSAGEREVLEPRGRDRAPNANANASSESLHQGESGGEPIPPPLFSRNGHQRHAFCGHVCVPDFMHERFVRQSGGEESEANDSIRRWYLEVGEKWAGRAVGDKPEDFWAARFRERTGSTVATSGAARRPAVLPGPAEWRYVCNHDRQHRPLCQTPEACELRFAKEPAGAA